MHSLKTYNIKIPADAVWMCHSPFALKSSNVLVMGNKGRNQLTFSDCVTRVLERDVCKTFHST